MSSIDMPDIKAVMLVLYDFNPQDPDAIAVKEDQVVYLLSSLGQVWSKVQRHLTLEELSEDPVPKAEVGLVPSFYLSPYPTIGPATALSDYEADRAGEIPIKQDESVIVYFREGEWVFVGVGDDEAVGVRFGYVPKIHVQEGYFEFNRPTKSTSAGKPEKASVDKVPESDRAKPDPSKVRLWHDASGQFRVQAQPLGLVDGTIRLHKVNGVIIQVPLEKMSWDDRIYIAESMGNSTVAPSVVDPAVEGELLPVEPIGSASLPKDQEGILDTGKSLEGLALPIAEREQHPIDGQGDEEIEVSQADNDTNQRSPSSTFEDPAVQADVVRTEAYLEILRRFQGLSWPNSLAFQNYDKLDLSTSVTYEPWAAARGHFSDVHKGNMEDKIVAVKILRLPTYNPYNKEIYEKTFLRFFREMTHWSELKHVNIVHMIGFTATKGVIGLVSLWHANGNLVEYLAINPDASAPDLMLDVAEGTRYLHEIAHFVHGDLKGMNILINEHGVACLADFGISQQMNDVNRHTGFTTTGSVTGTTYWMAPEIMRGERPSYSSDVYSCAGVFLEICAKKCPFHYLSGFLVAELKLRGELPQRSWYPELTGKDSWWELFSLCWDAEANKRPTIGTIVRKLYDESGLEPRVIDSITRRPSKVSDTEL